VRQPEVARALALLLALLLSLPTLTVAATALVVTALWVELLGPERARPLSLLAPAPRRSALAGLVADRYVAPVLWPRGGLVLVHGYTPEGKDDPRVIRAAHLLARAGFEVLVPTVPGLTRGQLRLPDVEPVVRALAAADPGRPATVVGVSLGAGPAFLAAADPRVRARVGLVVAVGGYASARELVRFFLTGEYAWGTVRGRVIHDPEIVRTFLAANADLLAGAPAAARGLLDPGRLAAWLEAPPPALAVLLDALSPERVVGALPSRILLVHGRDDHAVPFTESLRLAAARPTRTHLVLVGSFRHVAGPDPTWRWEHVVDGARVWGATYLLLAART
jgi:pimeloyl-ACP methyl ester carboxylesterase